VVDCTIQTFDASGNKAGEASCQTFTMLGSDRAPYPRPAKRSPRRRRVAGVQGRGAVPPRELILGQLTRQAGPFWTAPGIREAALSLRVEASNAGPTTPSSASPAGRGSSCPSTPRRR